MYSRKVSPLLLMIILQLYKKTCTLLCLTSYSLSLLTFSSINRRRCFPVLYFPVNRRCFKQTNSAVLYMNYFPCIDTQRRCVKQTNSGLLSSEPTDGVGASNRQTVLYFPVNRQMTSVLETNSGLPSSAPTHRVGASNRQTVVYFPVNRHIAMKLLFVVVSDSGSPCGWSVAFAGKRGSEKQCHACCPRK